MSETSDSTTTPSRSQAREVREEDAFDVEALADWLRDNASPEWADSIDGTPEVRQFAGGASNLTYLLTYSQGTELILRRPPGGTKSKGAHNMGREYRIQTALRSHFPPVPATVALCEDESVIGSSFYVMERISGPIPRQELPRKAPIRRRTSRPCARTSWICWSTCTVCRSTRPASTTSTRARATSTGRWRAG